MLSSGVFVGFGVVIGWDVVSGFGVVVCLEVVLVTVDVASQQPSDDKQLSGSKQV